MMRRRLFLSTGVAAGLAGLAAPSALSGALASTRSPRRRPPFPLPADPDRPIRLNLNENPLGLSPAARHAITANFEGASLYGGETRRQLVEAIAARHGVEPEHIVLGNGSTDVLRLAAQALGGPGLHLVAAEPTYGDIFNYARVYDARVTRIPLRPDHAHDLDRMREAAERGGSRVMVYLCNPNNPTGTLTPTAEIDRWISEASEDILFVVDEAYHDYVDDAEYRSAERWARERPNVVVCRTFSKVFAMAGLRLGYGIAQPETVRRMRAYTVGNVVSHLSAVAGIASLKDGDFLRESVRLNAEAKAVACRTLDALGIEYFPSHANFLMHRIHGDHEAYTTRMREHGLLVGRPFPPLLEHSRLSLALPDQMEYFGRTLRVFREKGWV